MFFAVWRRAGQQLSPPLQARVVALTRAAVESEAANAAVAAWLPARIVQQGPAIVVHAACDRAGSRFPGHPSARLEGEVLTIAAGTLPQFPLYYALAPDGSHLLACSQLGPLASLLPSAPLDAQRLISLVAYGADTDTPTTVYTGIRRLRSCEVIVGERDEVRVTRAFPRIAGAYRRGKPEDLAMELRHRLDGAVRRAMGASKRIAAFVSGGLDSSGMLTLAAAQMQGEPGTTLDAISILYAGRGDDRPHFAQLMRGLDLSVVRLRPQDAVPWFRQSLCMDAQPGNLASTCLFLLAGATAVERRAEVVLTGVSGDSVCGGLLPFARLAHLAAQGQVIKAVHHAMRLRLPWRMGPMRRVRYVLSSLVPEPARRVKRRFARDPDGPAWMTPRSRDLLARCRASDECARSPVPDTPDGALQYLCTHGQMADGADAVGQLATVTRCLPVDVFLDEEFVRFMIEIDPVLLSHGHQFRGLYRLAMKGLLPEQLRRRQDKGSFEPAVAAAAGSSGVDLLSDLSSLEALASRGLADPGPFRKTLDACLAMLRRGERAEELPADEHLQAVWQLLSVEAFLREYGQARALS